MDKSKIEPILIDMNQAVKMSGISRSKLYKMIRSPECDWAIKCGPKKFFIKKKLFEEFLMNRDSI